MDSADEPVDLTQVDILVISRFQTVLDLMPGILFGHGVNPFLHVEMPAIDIGLQ